MITPATLWDEDASPRDRLLSLAGHLSGTPYLAPLLDAIGDAFAVSRGPDPVRVSAEPQDAGDHPG